MSWTVKCCKNKFDEFSSVKNILKCSTKASNFPLSKMTLCSIKSLILSKIEQIDIGINSFSGSVYSKLQYAQLLLLLKCNSMLITTHYLRHAVS
jgi:hypothetical protein